MKRILVACPMTREADMLRVLLGEREGLEVTASGIGIKRTLPLLLRRLREDPPDLLIFTGSVTQLNTALAYRQVVLPLRWTLEPGGPCFDCSVEPDLILADAVVPIALALSISRPVMRSQQREQLFSETGAEVYDSVTAAVVRIAGTSQVPVVTPKIIANTVDSGLMTFWGQLELSITPLVDYLSAILERIHES